MARVDMRAWRWGTGGVWWLVVVGCLTEWGWAEAPAERFLAALRESRYHDVALLYLDRMDAHPATPPDFQREIALQRGITLIQAASLERDVTKREEYLRAAKENLDRFLREQPDHPKKSASRKQFGVLLREWGRMKAEQAARAGDATTRQEAVALYDQAYAVFDSAVTELREQLGTMQQDPEVAADPDVTEQRETLRNEFLDALMRRAEVREDRADAEPADSAERPRLYAEALNLYGDMFSKYPRRLHGVRARLNAARVQVKLGDFDTALQYIEQDVVAQEDVNPPLVRQLITQGFLLAMDGWMHESRREYATAVARAKPWVDQIRPGEEEDPDWLMLMLRLAQAHRAWAEELQAADPRDPQIKGARDEARRLARAVTRVPGTHQAEARALLAVIPGGVRGTPTVQKPPAATFDEAKTNATDAMAEVQSAEYLARTLTERLQTETDPGVRAELQQQQEEATASVDQHRELARENLAAALGMADSQTPTDDVNHVRRLLAYLHYIEREYFDAAVLGEFVGRRFPASAGAQTSAQIALAAYLKLYEASAVEERDFATRRIVALASYMVETWAGSPEAAEAINTLIPFLVSRGEIDQARAYVENMPEDSPQRASGELRIGESLWRDYLVGMNQVRQWERELQADETVADELRETIARRKPELEALKTAALGVLETGIDRLRNAGTVNETVPRAVLALAQIYVDLDQAPRAMALLDDEQIGVLPMLQRRDAAIDQPVLREQVYRVALSAVVSALPHAKGPDERAALVQRSRTLMDALRQEVGDTADAPQRLIEVLYGLARGLETQITLLERPQDRQVLSEGLGAFLEQVRGESQDVRILNWVAESYASLGRGLADDPQSAAVARQCFAQAIATYQQILAVAGPEPLSPEMRRQLQVRLALAQRAGGQFADAIATLRELLVADGRIVDVQVEAAMTYQLWGAEPQQAAKYRLAVSGGELDPESQKNIIWGWNRISQMTARYQDYRDVYHQARYNAAQCHYKYALRLRQAADREKYLKSARDYIVYTQRLYPQLGGAERRAKYDALLKSIQRALNEPAVGLGKS